MTNLKRPIEYGLPDKFRDYLPGQEDAILSVAEQFRSGKQVVLLSAPTGSGKSLCSMALSRHLAEQYPSDFSTVISVQTIALQNQYAADFPSIVSVVGRGNFQCAKQSDLNVNEGLCTLPGYKCEDKWVICPYYIQKAAAAHAAAVVSNSAFLLHELAYTDGAVCGNRNLMVIDEGHLLENAVMNFVSVLLPERSLRAVGVDLPHLRDPDDAKRWAEQIHPIVARGYSERSASVSAAVSGDGNVDVRDIRTLLGYKAMAKRLETLKNIEPGKWFLAKTYAGYQLKPFYVDEFVPRLVTNHAPRVLMMSATFLSSMIMTKLLGLDAKTTGWVEMDSTFPAERRPYNFIPLLRVNRDTGSVGYKRLTKGIDQVLEIFPNDRGTVHTGSFDKRDKYLSYTAYPERFITHRRSSSDDKRLPSRDEAIAEFLRTSEPKVLISPSIRLGLDLYDDRARFQIIPSLPWLSLGDPQVRYRFERDKKWYDWACIAALVQQTGRSTRHARDWSTCFIFDAALWRLLKQRKGLFPKWWRDALHIIRSKDVDDAVIATR